jgi:hypothetical protein
MALDVGVANECAVCLKHLMTNNDQKVSAKLFKDQLAKMKLYFGLGASPNYLFPDGSTMMHIACALDPERMPNFITMVRMLVDCGAQTNMANAAGHTPLHILATNWSFENSHYQHKNIAICAQIILRAGCVVGTRDKNGLTALALSTKMYQAYFKSDHYKQRVSRAQEALRTGKPDPKVGKERIYEYKERPFMDVLLRWPAVQAAEAAGLIAGAKADEMAKDVYSWSSTEVQRWLKLIGAAESIPPATLEASVLEFVRLGRLDGHWIVSTERETFSRMRTDGIERNKREEARGVGPTPPAPLRRRDVTGLWKRVLPLQEQRRAVGKDKVWMEKELAEGEDPPPPMEFAASATFKDASNLPPHQTLEEERALVFAGRFSGEVAIELEDQREWCDKASSPALWQRKEGVEVDSIGGATYPYQWVEKQPHRAPPSPRWPDFPFRGIPPSGEMRQHNQERWTKRMGRIPKDHSDDGPGGTQSRLKAKAEFWEDVHEVEVHRQKILRRQNRKK